jgi:hypothetical protein
VASAKIVGKVIEFIEPVIKSVCLAIPANLCVALCVTNPVYIACFVIHVALVIIVNVYKFFEVGIELHDGVVDGAEINAILLNSEELIDSSCQILTDVADLKATVIAETDEIDDALACRKY